jgi:hypothetical protein
MLKPEADEAMVETNAVLAALALPLNKVPPMQLSRFLYLSGWLAQNGEELLILGAQGFWVALAACFEGAQKTGITFAQMETVRVLASGFVPNYPASVAVANFCIRMALLEEARILAATNFVSRQDVDYYWGIIDPQFDAAELVAADNDDNVAYQALLSLHAAVSNDLANRSRPLPLMTTFSFAENRPSLYLAQRIYCDPSRNDELIAENKPIHPLFMKQTITALSS